MNNIKSFEQYIKEEFFPTATKGEHGGSKLLQKVGDKVFGWIGDKTGNKVDTAYRLLKAEIAKQVKEGQISPEDEGFVYSKTKMSITEYAVENKSEEEILKMLKDRLELVKKEELSQFTKPVISEKRYYHNLQKVKK